LSIGILGKLLPKRRMALFSFKLAHCSSVEFCDRNY
jgi:hypothetical protein